MELMSSLLLCALIALLPQALGNSTVNNLHEKNEKHNNTQTKKSIEFIESTNGPRIKSSISELQSVFIDPVCRQCIRCMERAIMEHKTHSFLNSPRIDDSVVHDDVLTNQYVDVSHRDKRNVASVTKQTKKLKPKKKSHKSVRVTKYNMDGQVYALKVKEINSLDQEDNSKDSVSSCQMYNVKKSYACDSPEGDIISTATKGNVSKKNKGEDKSKTNMTTEKTNSITPVFRKRQVDNSQVLENYMSSVEELY